MIETIESTATTCVRPAVLADAALIDQVLNRNGMGRLDAAAWRFTWESYPFAAEFREIPIGWVLETAADEVVGFLSNVHMLYEMAGRRYKATIAASWAVDPAYRNKAVQMNSIFYKQKGVDLFLNVSTSPTVAKLLTALRVPRIPIPEYNVPCFWAVKPTAFALAALQRRHLPAASLLAYPAGMALLLRDVFLRSGRGAMSSKVRRLTAFDEQFDGLWDRIAAGPPRLRAIRNRAVLDWKFRGELDTGRAVILAAESAGKRVGYTVLVRRPGSDLGMNLYDVADLQAVGDDPAIYRDLLLGAVQATRQDGMDALKLMTGTPAKRSVANALRPHTYQLPFWQLYYKASPELSSLLGTAEAWDISLFDTY